MKIIRNFFQQLEITTVTPADNETDVNKKSNITITYNQSIIRGTSNITLTDASGVQMTTTIDVSVVDDGGGGNTDEITINKAKMTNGVVSGGTF